MKNIRDELIRQIDYQHETRLKTFKEIDLSVDQIDRQIKHQIRWQIETQIVNQIYY
jgi:hypothetical protein